MRLLRRFPGILLTLALVLASVSSRAAPSSPAPPARLPRKVRLEYTRPPGARECADEDTFRYAVAGHMVNKPFAQDAPDQLLVTIQRQGGSYKGRAEIRTSAGSVLWSFTTELDECHLITDALAIAIGLALDTPEPKVEPLPAPPAAPPAASATPPAAPVTTPAPTPAAPPDDDAFSDRDRMRGRVSMGMVVGVGLMPRPGIGPDAGLGFQWRHFSMGAEARALLTPSFALDDKDHKAFAGLVLGVMSLCYDIWPMPRPFHIIELCPFLGAGRLLMGPASNQPDFIMAEAHPFDMVTGFRLPLLWQLSRKKAADIYLRAFAEADVILVKNHLSLNNVTLWGDGASFPLGRRFA